MEVEESHQIIHRVVPTDTLEGLALRYGVQVADLKRVNKLWTKGDMFARRQIIIPKGGTHSETNNVGPTQSRSTQIITIPTKPKSFDLEGSAQIFGANSYKDQSDSNGAGHDHTHSSSTQHIGMMSKRSQSLPVRSMTESARRRLEQETDVLYDL